MSAPPLGISLAAQSQSFLVSLALGAGLGLLYDLFRISRKALPLPGWVIALEDLLYCLLCAMASFVYLLAAADGRLRWFILMGELLGAVLYHLTVGELVMALTEQLLVILGAVLGLLWRLTGAPLLRILSWFGRRGQICGAKMKNSLKKSVQKHKNGLKRPGKILYNSFRYAMRRAPKRGGRQRGEG